MVSAHGITVATWKVNEGFTGLSIPPITEES